MTDENGEPWFVGKYVAEMLGYGNTRDALRKHVEEDDVAKRDTIDNMGRKQYTSFINESGLYALVFASKLPKAREFKHWVTSVVLPQIRRTGGHLPLSDGDTRESILRKALSIYDATVQIGRFHYLTQCATKTDTNITQNVIHGLMNHLG